MLKYILIAIFSVFVTTQANATTGTSCWGNIEGIPNNGRLSTIHEFHEKDVGVQIEFLWIGNLSQCDHNALIQAVSGYLRKVPAANNAELTAIAEEFRNRTFENADDVEVQVTHF